MAKTGKRGTAGFSLVEIIVAIAVLGLISAPVCASLVLAGRINAHSRAVMEAQLEVRTAVETLMEAGIEEAAEDLLQRHRLRRPGPGDGGDRHPRRGSAGGGGRR